ncbi:MAG: hypothetical protein V1705_00110 [bacterium]
MVEIIPKPILKTPLWQKILLYFSIGALLASAFSFFFLDRSVKNSSVFLDSLEKVLAKGKTQEEINMEKAVSGAAEKTKEFSKVSGEHLYVSNFFGFLEKITHRKVWLTQFDLDVAQAKASVFGEAESFSALGQQLLILDKAPEVEGFSLESVSISKDKKVVFNLNFFINPSSAVFAK